jgi:GTP-binding protein
VKFVDATTIQIRSGRGGDGCLSFKRAKNLPFGGPDGGPGGDGGNIVVFASENTDTLLTVAREQSYAARNGEPGGGRQRKGKTADDVVIKVPIGTVVYCSGEEVADLVEDGQTYLAARGGKGGLGNKFFASAVNQTPQEFTYGEEGEEKKLRLELKLIADVGLVGFPNAGKSTLLSRLSAARPKIADYPFTTMQPQLGIVSDGYIHELVMADIPGIIEGAAEGAGMGVDFLRHVERCRFLLHLVNLCPIDGTYSLDNYHAINRELHKFSPVLAQKPQIAVGNKLDLTGSEDSLQWLREELKIPVIGISAVTGEGLKELRIALFELLKQYPRT